jgi:hypothetical protein
MTDVVTIELTPTQLRIAETIGHARHNTNRRDGYSSRRVSRYHTDCDIHVIGALGEVAVALAEGKPLRCPLVSGTRLRIEAPGPDVGDWQVKTTTINPPILMVPCFCRGQMHDLKYLLCYAEPPRVTLVGWTWGAELFTDANVRPFRHYDAYVMTAGMLRPYVQPVVAS